MPKTASNLSEAFLAVREYRHGWLIKLSREFKDKE